DFTAPEADGIGADEAADLGIVVARAVVVEAGGGIPLAPGETEGPGGLRHAAGRGQEIPVAVVSECGDLASARVEHAADALQVVRLNPEEAEVANLDDVKIVDALPVEVNGGRRGFVVEILRHRVLAVVIDPVRVARTDDRDAAVEAV